MQLLNSFVSPFAARARIAIYAYDLPVDIAPSGQWLPTYEKSPEYLKINPIGRVPVLLLDDGSALPESGVIVEHLADAFPGTGLRPVDVKMAARARLLAHLAEIYVQLPANPLFGQVFAAQRNQRQIEGCVHAMSEGLSHLDHFLPDSAAADMSSPEHLPPDHLSPESWAKDGTPKDGTAKDGAWKDWPAQDRPTQDAGLAAGLAAGPGITLADCALAPFLFFFAERMVASFGMESIIRKRAKVAAYWDRVQAEPAVERVLSEMRTAIAASPLRPLLA